MKKQLSLFLTFCIVLTHQATVNDIPELSPTAIRGSRTPPSIKLEWLPIENDDRILGYRAKAWEIAEKVTLVYEVLYNGTEVPKMKKHFDINDLDKVPETNPDLVVDAPGRLNNSAKFENVKIDKYYQIFLLAYTKDGEGPLKYPTAIKIPASDTP